MRIAYLQQSLLQAAIRDIRELLHRLSLCIRLVTVSQALSVSLVAILSLLTATLTSQVVQRRDPQAISIIEKSLTATGWSDNSFAKDGTVECSISSLGSNGNWKQTLLTIKAMPHNRVRYETPSLTAVRDDRNLTIYRDGKRAVLSASAALSTLPEPFPFWTAWEDISQPTTILKYKGTGLVDGQIADKVLVSPLSDPSTKNSQLLSQFIFLVSQTSHLPIELQYNLQADNSPLLTVPSIIKWSEYKSFSGVTMPTRVRKYINGVLVTDMTISSAKWSSGLTQDDFNIR